MIYYAAFTLGLMGSLHCLAMCGPLAFALPVRTIDPWIRFFKYVSFHAARTCTYSFMGLMLGMIGKGFALAGFQQVLSVLSGLLVLVSVVLIYYPVKNAVISKLTFSLTQKLRSAFSKYFKESRWFTLPVLGVLNGLLPCGMVYAALMGAWGTGAAFSGAKFMLAFGMGTMPLMLGISMLGNFMGAGTKNMLSKITPVLACGVGLLLLVRGMDLGVPLLSPSSHENEIKCCRLK